MQTTFEIGFELFSFRKSFRVYCMQCAVPFESKRRPYISNKKRQIESFYGNPRISCGFKRSLVLFIKKLCTVEDFYVCFRIQISQGHLRLDYGYHTVNSLLQHSQHLTQICLGFTNFFRNCCIKMCIIGFLSY